ncbi:MAG: flagellar motor protein MotB [Bryobacterales bacterium]|nr:flagellar motor protein MotB [Bryobacterales bacterium]
MADEAVQPIIIIKKKSGHAGHHGGAWKVAYADFVTAMMALFIVLWLLSSSEKVQKAVGGYFQDPTGSGKLAGSNMAGVGETLSLSKDDMPALKEKLQQAVLDVPEFKKMKDQVQISVTGEGLRIELIETTKGMFFESGSSNPSSTGRDLLTLLAAELGKLPNIILLEGHTDAKPFGTGGAFTNWELSSDRANAARRIMQSSGLRADQVAQVRGYADQQLKNKEDPLDPRNRRISLIVQYRRPPGALEEADEDDEEEEAEAPAAAGHGDKAAKEPQPAHGEKPPAHDEKAAAKPSTEKPPREKVQMGVFVANKEHGQPTAAKAQEAKPKH